MKDFTFCIPTEFIVGKGSAAKVGEAIARRGGRKVLVVDDGGSYLKALLETVHASIAAAGIEAFDIPEKATSPRLSLIRDAIRFVKEKEIDFILAVGGGTVMDTAKGIAFLAENEGELTDYVLYRKFSPKCMPVASVVTLSGTGSEISATAMILDDSGDTPIKYPLFQESLRFAFSVMDPSLTLSLPMKQTLSGAFDAITHIMEHYFNGESGYDLQDRMCEGVMRSIMENMRAVVKDPADYETRAQLQMSATLANSTLLGLGCDSDWAVHYMENPITTATHEPHGWDLAIIAPAWMRYTYKRDLTKAEHFALRVMEVEKAATQEETAERGVAAFRAFLEEVGLPTKLSAIGLSPEQFPEMARRALMTAGSDRVGGISKLSEQEVLEIYQLAQ